MAKSMIAVRLDKEIIEKIESLSLEGNVSQWIRLLIQKEFERLQKEEEIIMKKIYADWRNVSEKMLEDGMNGSIDCGESKVREDFANFAGIEEISFEEMLELEKDYTKNETK
jgi:uncharacterized membrane protein YheB (UPF0754 family)